MNFYHDIVEKIKTCGKSPLYLDRTTGEFVEAHGVASLQKILNSGDRYLLIANYPTQSSVVVQSISEVELGNRQSFSVYATNFSTYTWEDKCESIKNPPRYEESCAEFCSTLAYFAAQLAIRDYLSFPLWALESRFVLKRPFDVLRKNYVPNNVSNDPISLYLNVVAKPSDFRRV